MKAKKRAEMTHRGILAIAAAVIAGLLSQPEAFAETPAPKASKQQAAFEHPMPTATLSQRSSKKRKSKKRRKKRSGVRKKILSSEAGTKKGQSTKIDFDEASIDGRRRAPMGVAINKNKGNDDYDLIKLRLKWHQEMVDSAANLETGKNR